MDLRNSSSYESITTIHEMGGEWGRLPHRGPLYVKRLRDRRKEPGVPRKENRAQENAADEKQHELHGPSGDREGFEVVV
jgi:hypothetical protein